MKRSTLAILLLVLMVIVGLVCYAVYDLYYSHRGKHTTAPVQEGLTRTVTGTTLTSLQYPSAAITFPSHFEYLGAHKFVLYGVANTEQYMFASSHENGQTKSMIVVQFESLLPDINGAYDYSSSPANIDEGGLTFWVDQHPSTRHWLVPNGRPGTDGYLHRSFMDDKGYPLPKYYIWTRLAYVPETHPREEMLIIYMEDLSPRGIVSADLKHGGKHAGRWSEIALENLKEIQSNIEIKQLD